MVSTAASGSNDTLVVAKSDTLVEPEQEMTVRIPKDLIVELAKLAEQLNVDPSSALRYAISTTTYLYNERQKGAALLLERGNKRYEVEWTTPQRFARQFARGQ